jgi:hypothetical protein
LKSREKKEDSNKLTFAAYVKLTLAIFKNAYSLLLSMYWVFTLTFIVFPGLFFKQEVAFLKDNMSESNYGAWKTTMISFIFALFDTVGRSIAGKLILKKGPIIILSLLRAVFFVTTFMIVNQQGKGIVNFLTGDIFILANLILFALSNGYVSTLCAIQTPSLVPQDQ